MEYIDSFILWLTNFLYLTWQQIGWIFSPDIFKLKPLLFVDIIILSFVIYWAYLLIRKTTVFKYLPAILIIVFAAGLGKILDLMAVNWIFSRLVLVIAVAIPVIFQSEIKEALGLMVSSEGKSEKEQQKKDVKGNQNTDNISVENNEKI